MRWYCCQVLWCLLVQLFLTQLPCLMSWDMKKYTVKHIQAHTTQYTFIIFLIYMLFKNTVLSTLMESMSTWSHDIFCMRENISLVTYVDGTDRCFRETQAMWVVSCLVFPPPKCTRTLAVYQGMKSINLIIWNNCICNEWLWKCTYLLCHVCPSTCLHVTTQELQNGFSFNFRLGHCY